VQPSANEKYVALSLNTPPGSMVVLSVASGKILMNTTFAGPISDPGDFPLFFPVMKITSEEFWLENFVASHRSWETKARGSPWSASSLTPCLRLPFQAGRVWWVANLLKGRNG
jgi:hypothetical protein